MSRSIQRQEAGLGTAGCRANVQGQAGRRTGKMSQLCGTVDRF